MADDNKLESTSSIPPMDLQTLYAGADFSYLEDDRSTQNSDDPGAEDRGDDLPPPVGEKKRKAEKEEADNEQKDGSQSDGDRTGEADDGSARTGEEADPESETGRGEGESEGDQEGANRVGSVPKWRLDQQTKKLRQTEREMATLKAQLEKLTGQAQPDGQPQADTAQQSTQKQASPDAQLQAQLKELQSKRNEIRDQYEEAIIDGDTKKTKAFREQLDAIEDDIFETRVNARTQKVQEETVSRTAIERELQTVADEVQAEYSVLDPNHDSYDEEIVNETVAYRDMLITSMNRKPGEALREAAETMAKKYDIPAAGKSDKKQNSEGEGQSRTEQRSKGKEKAAKQQPPKMPGKRNEAKVSDITSMTDAEFEKLTPEQRSELRGDYRVS